LKVRHYFNTKDTKVTKDTKEHPELSLTGTFVQLHTNTVRVPLALKLGGVLLTTIALGSPEVPSCPSW
jgi:hypothetical protein